VEGNSSGGKRVHLDKEPNQPKERIIEVKIENFNKEISKDHCMCSMKISAEEESKKELNKRSRKTS